MAKKEPKKVRIQIDSKIYSCDVVLHFSKAEIFLKKIKESLIERRAVLHIQSVYGKYIPGGFYISNFDRAQGGVMFPVKVKIERV